MKRPVTNKKCVCDNRDRLFDSYVINSRKMLLKRTGLNVISRRRVCNVCDGRFSTHEFENTEIKLFGQTIFVKLNQGTI